jgi:hypothetical protein
VELYIHSPNTPSWRGAQLKHRENFTFIIIIIIITGSLPPGTSLLEPMVHPTIQALSFRM